MCKLHLNVTAGQGRSVLGLLFSLLTESLLLYKILDQSYLFLKGKCLFDGTQTHLKCDKEPQLHTVFI